ncbi:hypothetical protein KKD52_09270 [Myxococcota bacterium]|nr:hypothetical protein [Myxococcota bacterium]MBU1510537.1 hypothetical protein [Myxococcota bacterium]
MSRKNAGDKKKKNDGQRIFKANQKRADLNQWNALVRKVAEACGALPLIDTMTPQERHRYQQIRVGPPVVRRDPASGIPARVYDRLDGALQQVLDHSHVTVPSTGRQLTFREYLTAGTILKVFVVSSERQETYREQQWVKRLWQLMEMNVSGDGGWGVVDQMTLALGLEATRLGDMEREMYMAKYDMVHRDGTSVGTEHYQRSPGDKRPLLVQEVFEVTRVPGEVRTLHTKDGPRRCFRVFEEDLANEVITPLVLRTDQIPGHRDLPARELPVFALNHVRHRMTQRLEPLNPTLIDYFLGQSVRYAVPVPSAKGGFLIALKYYQSHLGYLVGEVVDDAVLLKTFLFITQSGTPTGDRLDALLRVGTYEKHYFELDRLKTFCTTDLSRDPLFLELLEKCGIVDLPSLVRFSEEVEGTPPGTDGYAEKVRAWMNLDEKLSQRCFSST